MTLMEISITSDPVCPWCYIGYRRLTKAISIYQKTYPGGRQDDIRISWNPYFLDRDAPMESIPYIERMTRKVGAEKVVSAQARLLRLGLAEGIHFRFGGKIGNTTRAHQLIMFSELHDKQNSSSNNNTTTAVVEAMFRAHFEDERDISDVDTLVQIAEQASLDASRVRTWLETGQGVAEIEQMAEQARKEGLQGVPYFQMGDGLILNGAQGVEEFYYALVTYKEGQKATTTTTTEKAIGSC